MLIRRKEWLELLSIVQGLNLADLKNIEMQEDLNEMIRLTNKRIDILYGKE